MTERININGHWFTKNVISNTHTTYTPDNPLWMLEHCEKVAPRSKPEDKK